MKLAIVIIIIFLSLKSFGQNYPISYSNNERQKTELELLDWDDRISDITLKNESEFEFLSFPSIISCLTWQEYNGIWKRKNDTIAFIQQYLVEEFDAKFEFSENPSQKYFLIQFKVDDNSTINEKKVNIVFMYDLDSNQRNIKLDYELSDDFELKIPYKDIPNIEQLASLRYSCSPFNNKMRFGFITQGDTVNVKETEIPNQICITFIKNPKSETVYRTTKAILKGHILKIISSQKTKTELPDHNPDLKFKEYYTMQSEK